MIAALSTSHNRKEAIQPNLGLITKGRQMQNEEKKQHRKLGRESKTESLKVKMRFNLGGGGALTFP